MKKKQKQDIEWNNIDVSTPDGLEYKNWVIKVGREYLENKKNQSWIFKIIEFLFGTTDILGQDLVNQYGKHNIEKYDNRRT